MDANALTSIAAGIRATTVAETPVRHQVQLTPPGGLAAGQDDTVEKLVVTDPFELKHYVADKPVEVDLTLLLKQVRFLDSALEKPDPANPESTIPSSETVGGMPLTDALMTAAGKLVMPTLSDLLMENTTTPVDVGVPGLLGALRGTMQLPVEQIIQRAVQRDVKLELRVQVFEGAVPATDIVYAGELVANPSGGVETPGPMTKLPTVGIEFPVRFTELTKPGPPPTTSYAVRSSVRLSIDAVPPMPEPDQVPAQRAITTDWVALPAVTVPVPLVPIPTVVAMFTGKNYTEKALVVVPGNSAVGSPGLSLDSAFTTTTELLKRIDANHPLVRFLAGEAGRTVVNLVPTQYQVLRAQTDSIHDLSAYEFEGLPDRLTAEDSVESIVVLARPGEKVNFNLERTREDNTASASPIVTTTEFMLAIADLEALDAGGVPKVQEGTGRVDNWGHPGPWHNRLSAIYFP